ncbi:MAG TPA: hypothetical protein VJP79_02555 [Nitrososphaera sp.]|nr:hypothetical protein [Nitrososphaera sp.]
MAHLWPRSGGDGMDLASILLLLPMLSFIATIGFASSGFISD